MSEVTWGVPTQQKRAKVEMFTTPVVTMGALNKPGAGRKLSFNQAAQKMMGLEKGESYVAIGFGNDNSIFIQAFAKEVDHGFALTKTCSFSNKRVFEYIAKIQELDVNLENYLHLEEVEGAGLATVNKITTSASTDTDPKISEEMVSEQVFSPSEEVEEILDEVLDVKKTEEGEQSAEW